MKKDTTYDIVSGPSWADLKEATFQGTTSPHRPSIHMKVEPREEDPDPEFRVLSETVSPTIRLVGAESGDGIRFVIEVALQDDGIWHGYYDTKNRSGWLKAGMLSH